jgi:hypothetical protein
MLNHKFKGIESLQKDSIKKKSKVSNVKPLYGSKLEPFSFISNIFEYFNLLL